MKQVNIFQLAAYAVCLTGSLAASAVAFAQNGTSSRENVVSLSASASDMVANDEIQATLYVEEQHEDAANLADSLNRAMNAALKTAKAYPSVAVSTGQQSTYPNYSKNNRIIGWQGRGQIHLTSNDLAQTSKLIAKLQSSMKLENVRFSVSDEKREQIETQLMQQASQKLQARADALLPVWQAKSYQLIHLQLNTNSRYAAPVAYGARMNMADAAVSSQNFASGESKVTVTAKGRIQLQK